MYGLKLKTVTTQGSKQSQVFGTVTLLQTVPGQQHNCPPTSPLSPSPPSSSKLALAAGNNDHLDLVATLTPHPDLDRDLKMMEDLGMIGFSGVDSLGDAGLDCFGDLSSMMETNFLSQPDNPGEEQRESLTYLSLQPALKPQHSGGVLQLSQDPFNTAFLGVSQEDMDEDHFSSDLAQLASNVGLKRPRTPSLDDHDYSTKRARLNSTVSSVAHDLFIVPETAPSPAPSSASDMAPGPPPPAPEEEDDKRKNRRVKNNLASKRSREIRKQKFVSMAHEAKKLTEENARLARRVADMEKLAQRMKDALVNKLKIQT